VNAENGLNGVIGDRWLAEWIQCTKRKEAVPSCIRCTDYAKWMSSHLGLREHSLMFMDHYSPMSIQLASLV